MNYNDGLLLHEEKQQNKEQQQKKCVWKSRNNVRIPSIIRQIFFVNRGVETYQNKHEVKRMHDMLYATAACTFTQNLQWTVRKNKNKNNSSSSGSND